MRKIIFLNEDVVDDYVKNYKKSKEYEKLIDARRKKYIRGGVLTGVGANLATLIVTSPLAIPFLIIGPRNLRSAGRLMPKLRVLSHNIGKETLEKIKYFNNIVNAYPSLRKIYKKLESELRRKEPDDNAIKELADKFRDTAREEGITLEYISDKELSKKSK
jgi:hypothetical protein